MSATLELFEAWKAAKGYTTDSAAGHALKVSRQTVNNWRSRGGNAEAHVIERMAADLGRDPVPVILQAFAEASKSAEARRSLGRLARRLGAACVALLALLPLTMETSAYTAPGSQDAHAGVYIMRTGIAARLARIVRKYQLLLRQLHAWLTDFPTETHPCNHRVLCPASP